MNNGYAAIGRAVAFAQIFETALIPIFEFYKMETKPGYLEQSGGVISAGAFKVPIKNIIKVLSKNGDIAPDVEARLATYVEDRHLLVHRWFLTNGWPADNDTAGFAPIIKLANRVEREAMDLTRLFTDYMAQIHLSEEGGADIESYKARMTGIFLRAHLG